ncbi:MAG: hypothetical protein ACXVPE_16285 [Bacteroidia bacterium]
MIDGIQLTFTTRNPKSHLLGLPCWEVLVNEKTGTRVNEIRTAHFRGLDLKLKPSSYDGHNFIANGSLHKFHNCGEHNADQFTFLKLRQSIDSFTDIFGIDPGQCYLHGLEIGVNISLPFSPLKVLKNLVCFRAKPFTQINKRSLTKGLQCSLTQYRVKVYDKAKQSGVDCGNVLRFEVAIDKMQVLAKYGISTLVDLHNVRKVYSLFTVLKDALGGIVWTDTTTDLNRLSDRELKQWLYYSNPKTWEHLGKYQRLRAGKAWEKLLHKYGNLVNLLPFVLSTWESLFLGKLEAENPQPFYQPILKSEAEETATFLPLVCTVKRLQPPGQNHTISNTTFLRKEAPQATTKQPPETIPKKRFCPSCGRDISTQDKQTVFCSEKFYGKTAKQCRNKSSNKRRHHKRKIQSAMKKNNYLLITYTDETGPAFSDVLHPSEVSTSKEWLDQIQSITALSFKLQTTKLISHAKTFTKKIR